MGMESKKQTSVDWLLDKLKSQGLLIGEIDNLVAVNQAKEMEKQQLESCYNHGSFSLLEHGHGDTFNEYYTKTFKP
jgi:hypothetical protein